MKIGMLFPGQGAQHLAMGKDIYDRERIVQEYFEEASTCLDQNFVRLCFASSEKELKETVNAQTSIFLVSAAFYSLLQTKYGITPDIVAGHSSGEYAAIFAAGGMNFPDALYLLKKRAFFMEEATKTTPGSMVAIIGLDYPTLKNICDKYDDPSGNERVVEIVNYNSPMQLVISGTLPELEAVSLEARAAKAKVIPLNVAGAFHSRLMKDAEQGFSAYMVKVDFKDLTIPMLNNIEAKVVTSNEDVKDSLVRQMSAHVLWWPAMEKLKDCDLIIEIGPGNKLAKMLKREWPDKEILPLNNSADLELILRILGKDIIPSELALDLEAEMQALTSKVAAKENEPNQ